MPRGRSSKSKNPHNNASTHTKQRKQNIHHAKDFYLRNDANAPQFNEQLSELGLCLRDVPADGNCLFSAISDQMYGNCSKHLVLREFAVQFIIEHGTEFAPFCDVTNKNGWLSELRRSRTPAGQEAIVALATHLDVDIVIHQLEQNPWVLSPLQTSSRLNTARRRQLHIAYHNGDHYSSVRIIGDNSCTPVRIVIPFPSVKTRDNEHKYYDTEGMDEKRSEDEEIAPSMPSSQPIAVGNNRSKKLTKQQKRFQREARQEEQRVARLCNQLTEDNLDPHVTRAIASLTL